MADKYISDIVVRLYESGHMATECVLSTTLPVKSAELCNMLERREGALGVRGGAMKLSFKPFEIKTVRLKMK